jgi:glc operon protein GlcG
MNSRNDERANQTFLEVNQRRLQMKSTGVSFLTAAALLCVFSTALSQQKPAQSAAGASASGFPQGQIRPMTVQYAKQIVGAAVKAACAPPAGECAGVFAIVDDAGVLIYLEAIDGVLATGPELAIKKAITPALWRRPTQTFKDAVDKGTNASYADGSFPHMTTSPGGIPLVKDGRIVGGFGIAAVGSGAATKQVNDAVMAEVTKIFGKQ